VPAGHSQTAPVSVTITNEEMAVRARGMPAQEAVRHQSRHLSRTTHSLSAGFESCAHCELFPACPRTAPAVRAHFEMERLTPGWSRVLTYKLQSELKPRNDPLGTWRSMAPVLPALWRVPYSGATIRHRHFGLDVRDGFHGVSVIASMIDMVEFTCGSSSSAPRRALVGTPLEDTSIHRSMSNPIIQVLGVLGT
jgi:hypothetical protein